MATLTVYGTNTAEVGYSAAATWATAHDATAGTYCNNGGAVNMAAYWRTVDSKYYVQRLFVEFDTSSLGSTATITGATLSFYGNAAAVGGEARAYNVYSSTASNPVVAADFDLVGTTALCDSAIAAASWSTTGFNDYVLNASGIASINKTGTTRFSTREVNLDVANVAPTVKANVFVGWTSGSSSSDYPKLVINYTTPSPSSGFLGSMALGIGVGI